MKSRKPEPRPLRPWGQSGTTSTKTWVSDKIQGITQVGKKDVLGETEVPQPPQVWVAPPTVCWAGPSHPGRDPLNPGGSGKVWPGT